MDCGVTSYHVDYFALFFLVLINAARIFNFEQPECKAINFVPVSSCDDDLGVSPFVDCNEKSTKKRFGFFNGNCVQYIQDRCEPTRNNFTTKEQCLRSEFLSTYLN